MLVTTTPTIEDRKISEYYGIVTGEAIVGANIIRDLFASIRDIVGGRAAAYEESLGEARNAALDDMAARARELGADAIIGVDLDYEVLGDRGSILMVSVTGTAVRLSD